MWHDMIDDDNECTLPATLVSWYCLINWPWHSSYTQYASICVMQIGNHNLISFCLELNYIQSYSVEITRYEQNLRAYMLCVIMPNVLNVGSGMFIFDFSRREFS